MNRIRLPLAALALFLLAACQSAAPTAPVDPRAPTTRAQFNGDSAAPASGADRGGSLIGSGNCIQSLRAGDYSRPVAPQRPH